MFGVSLDQSQVKQIQEVKADFKQTPVSEEVQNILAQHGAPPAANLGELQSYLTQVQGENPGKYNQLLDALYPGLRNQGFDSSPIQRIER